MKKLLLSAFLLLGLTFNTKAQELSKNALGLRLGSNNGFGTEISYQRGLFKNNRLEIDLGWRSDKDDVDNFKVVGCINGFGELTKGSTGMLSLEKEAGIMTKMVLVTAE